MLLPPPISASEDPADSSRASLPPRSAEPDHWEAFLDSLDADAERFEVAYEEASLPACLVRPGVDRTPRPALVMTGGEDESLAQLWAAGGETALKRGWNVILYDGPGQRSMLADRGIPFRPDWEAVLSPVVDALIERPLVDRDALMSWGVGQGGYFIARALAFDSRFAAAAVDPGIMDVSASWLSQLPPELVPLLRSGHPTYFEEALLDDDIEAALRERLAARAVPYGFGTLTETFHAVEQYHLRGIVTGIRTPLLIMPTDDAGVWRGQAEDLARALGADHELELLARTEDDDSARPGDRRSLTANRVIDHFERRLPTRPRTVS